MTEPLKTDRKTVIRIVAEHLRDNGFDGLVHTDAECGCEVDDLAPCRGDFGSCEAAHRGMSKDEPGEWAMYVSKDAAERSKTDGGEQP